MNTHQLPVIKDQIERGRQGWTARRIIVTPEGFKVRTTIDQDSYEFQSFYYAEVFSASELKWNRVHSEPSSDWYERLPYAYWRDDKPDAKEDAVDFLHDTLLRVTLEILEGIEA